MSLLTAFPKLHCQLCCRSLPNSGPLVASSAVFKSSTGNTKQLTDKSLTPASAANSESPDAEGDTGPAITSNTIEGHRSDMGDVGSLPKQHVLFGPRPSMNVAGTWVEIDDVDQSEAVPKTESAELSYGNHDCS